MPKPTPMPPPVEMDEQDTVSVLLLPAVADEVAVCLIVSVLLLQDVADEVVPLRLVDCFG